jgi:hypothetical protein
MALPVLARVSVVVMKYKLRPHQLALEIRSEKRGYKD